MSIPSITTPWRVLDAPALCALDIPARDSLLGPILVKGTVALLRGPKGVGKSYLALEIAHAVASGGRALSWQAPAPRRVLFVDADMPLALLQERLRAISLGRPSPGLDLLAADAQDEMPGLGWPEGLERLEGHLDGVNLLILDGVSSLMADGPSSRWRDLALALRRWRQRGVAVMLVESHAWRGGARALEGLIELTLVAVRPLDHELREGLRCDVLIESARTHLASAVPLEAAVDAAGGCRVMARANAEVVRALRLSHAGYSVRDIARSLRTSKSRAQRLIAEGRDAVEAIRLEREAATSTEPSAPDEALGTRGTVGPARRSPKGEGGTPGTLGTLGTASSEPPPDPAHADIPDLIRAIQIRGQPDQLPPYYPAARLAALSEDTLRAALEAKLSAQSQPS